MPWSREDFYRKYAFSLNDLYSHAPAPGVMKFTILVDHTLVIMTIHFVCMDYAPE